MEAEPQQTIQRSAHPRASEVHRFFDFRAFVPQRENTQITRRYKLGSREVGAGTYGKVFVGEDKEVVGRKVAVKKFTLNNREMRALFEREVNLMKELDHPNICKILETYENDRTVWVVMEYCAGGEVFQRIAECGGIPELETARIVKQVAGALKYAHNRGIAHRDLKPENICFCTADRSNDHVKVIDWGVGFHFNASGMSSAVGSSLYAGPEVLQANERQSYTAACDLWSLGVVTYVMRCGKPPFWGALQEQLKRMTREHYPMSDATWQATSAEAKDFIKRLLRADPTQRLTIDAVLAHPWLAHADGGANAAGGALTQQVLSNCRRFTKCDNFSTICAASVAKQLDHSSLQDVYKVFVEMDTNRDGVLELREVIEGFEKMYGKGSPEAVGVEDLFNRLDLDGSGQIDYTEFCAAGLGVHERARGDSAADEMALRAAFKAFDINDDNGRISRDEIQRVLQSADIGKTWSKEVCEQLTEEIFERYDDDKDGSIDFQEFLRLMRDPRYRRSGSGGSLAEIIDGLDGVNAERSAASDSQAAEVDGIDGVAATPNDSVAPTLLGRRVVLDRLSMAGNSFKDLGEVAGRGAPGAEPRRQTRSRQDVEHLAESRRGPADTGGGRAAT